MPTALHERVLRGQVRQLQAACAVQSVAKLQEQRTRQLTNSTTVLPSRLHLCLCCSGDEGRTEQSTVAFKSLVSVQAAPDVRKAPPMYLMILLLLHPLTAHLRLTNSAVLLAFRWTRQAWLWWTLRQYHLDKHTKSQVRMIVHTSQQQICTAAPCSNIIRCSPVCAVSCF